MGLHHEIRKLSLEARRFYDVVVNPVVIAAARFVQQQAVVAKAVLLEPFFRDFAVRVGAGSEESNEMPVVKPFVDDFERIGVGEASQHSLRLLVGNIVANGAVNIYEEVLFSRR